MYTLMCVHGYVQVHVYAPPPLLPPPNLVLLSLVHADAVEADEDDQEEQGYKEAHGSSYRNVVLCPER